MPKRILFFGDSNTYGFDPRDFWGGRYDEEKRWTHILGLNRQWEILEAGENGREIPHVKWQFDDLDRIIKSFEPFDCFAVMLGTNDLLTMYDSNAEAITVRMEEMLKFVMKHKAIRPEVKLLLVAPPEVRLTGDFSEIFRLVSHRMRESFNALAEKLGVSFADAGDWNIDMAYDGVHFSEDGHERFAYKMNQFLEGLLLDNNHNIESSDLLT